MEQVFFNTQEAAWEQENHLTLVPGYTGNVAKDVGAYLVQMH